MRRLAAGLAVVLLAGADLPRAYVQSRLSQSPFSPLRWDLAESGTDLENVLGGKVLYRLHPAGSDDVADGSDLTALEGAFLAWEQVPEATVAFLRDADLSGQPGAAADSFNSLFWAEQTTVVGPGLDISGALAVTFLFGFIDGPEAGEIVDADIVFNGVDFGWTTTPDSDPGRFDIRAVAVHEIGHLLGLDHSPIGFSTMFPRVRSGDTLPRTLEPDDRIAVAGIYPRAGFPADTGVIAGSLTSLGVPRFGGHVVAADAGGNVVAGALSQPDGSYRLEGLPPGTYSVFAEPLNPVGDPVLFSEENLGGFYSGLDTDFATTPDVSVPVAAGFETILPIDAESAGSSLDVLLVRDSPGSAYANAPASLFPGETAVTIGVAGPGLPSSGSPLSITGTGVVVLSPQFGILDTGSEILPVVEAVVDVDPAAPPGGRSLVVTSGARRTVAAGFLEVLGILLVRADPASAVQGETVAARLLGEGFLPSTTVDFGTGVTVTGITLVSEKELSAAVQVDPRALLGPRDLRAVNPDGSTASLPIGFRVDFDCTRADLNGSQRVDGFDLSRFARAFGGSSAGPGFDPEADFDGDGDIDGSDLALLLPLFGQGTGSCSP